MEIVLTDAMLKQIDDYIKGTLTNTQRIAFEKQMEDNVALKEEVALQQELIALIGQEKWIDFKKTKDNEELAAIRAQLRSEKFQNASKKIKQIGLDNYKEKPTEESPKKKKYGFYYISAAAMVLLFFGVFFMNRNTSLDNYYADYADWNNELNSFVVKNDGTDYFSKGEIAFKKRNYTEALKQFNAIETNNKRYPYSLMYKGAAYELTNKNDEAITAFNELIAQTNFEEHTKGYWYKLLVYLKLEDKENVKAMLDIILKDKANHKYNEALKIAEALKD
jgi:hypothetical protein